MGRNDKAYLLAVATMVLAVFILSLHNFIDIGGLLQDAPAAKSIGKPRNIDSQEIRSLINQEKLSDQDAQFHTPSP